jgi:hypothetical protein
MIEKLSQRRGDRLWLGLVCLGWLLGAALLLRICSPYSPEPTLMQLATTNGTIRFCLSNATAREIGFDIHGGQPFYAIAVKSGPAWETLDLWWCGFGKEEQSLAPAESFVFNMVPTPSGGGWRIGIQYWSGGTTSTVWSDEGVGLSNHAAGPGVR